MIIRKEILFDPDFLQVNYPLQEHGETMLEFIVRQEYVHDFVSELYSINEHVDTEDSNDLLDKTDSEYDQYLSDCVDACHSKV